MASDPETPEQTVARLERIGAEHRTRAQDRALDRATARVEAARARASEGCTDPIHPSAIASAASSPAKVRDEIRAGTLATVAAMLRDALPPRERLAVADLGARVSGLVKDGPTVVVQQVAVAFGGIGGIAAVPGEDDPTE